MALLNMPDIPLYYAEMIPGVLVNENPHNYTVLNHVAGGPVKVASFVWLDNTDRAVNTGTGQPLGFVVRLQSLYIRDITQEAVFTAIENDPLTILRAGDIPAQSAAAVTVGQKVFANLTTGAVSTAAAGATVSGAIETSWIVKYVSPDSNNVFIMSNTDPVDVAGIDARLTALE